MSHFSVSVDGKHQLTGCASHTLCTGASPNTLYDQTGAPVWRSKATIDFQ
jgi:hypothetical protein